MAALAQDRNTPWREPDVTDYPVAASTKIYAGAMVALNTSGYAIPAADAASLIVVGVAWYQADNGSGSNGDVNVVVKSGKQFKLNAASITQAMVGKVMYVVDDQTFDDGIGTNSIKAGILRKFISTTEGEIEIRPGAWI